MGFLDDLKNKIDVEQLKTNVNNLVNNVKESVKDSKDLKTAVNKIMKKETTPQQPTTREHYEIPRDYLGTLSNVVIRRKINNEGFPLSQAVFNVRVSEKIGEDEFDYLPIYIIEAPEIESVDGDPIEVYVFIDTEKIVDDFSYKISIRDLFAPNRVEKAFKDNGGYLGKINNRNEVEIDEEIVENIKKQGLEKKAKLNGYCKKAEKKLKEIVEAKEAFFQE